MIRLFTFITKCLLSSTAAIALISSANAQSPIFPYVQDQTTGVVTFVVPVNIPNLTVPILNATSLSLKNISITDTITVTPTNFNNTPFNLSLTLSGSALPKPTTGFIITPQTAISNETYTNLTGWVQNTTTGDGQTGAFAHYITITGGSNTLGATGAWFVSTNSCQGNKAGAQDFIANASCQTFGGQVLAGQANVYLQGLGDFLINDAGFNVAGIGEVMRAHRTIANAASLGLDWEGYLSLSDGTKMVDSLFHGVGLTRIGLDLSGIAVTSGPQVAIAVPAGYGLYGNATLSTSGSGTDCTANAVASSRSVCVNPGNDSIVDGGGTWLFNLNSGGSPVTVLTLRNNLVELDQVTQFVFSTTGAGTQTFTNSPCNPLTTEEWIPTKINGKAHTYYIPACDAGF